MSKEFADEEQELLNNLQQIAELGCEGDHDESSCLNHHGSTLSIQEFCRPCLAEEFRKYVRTDTR